MCFYLRFTELQMKEIAVRVGFSSAQNLAKFFQKEKRCSIDVYKRQPLDSASRNSPTSTAQW